MTKSPWKHFKEKNISMRQITIRLCILVKKNCFLIKNSWNGVLLFIKLLGKDFLSFQKKLIGSNNYTGFNLYIRSQIFCCFFSTPASGYNMNSY
jgi:hypothetical protein